MTNTNLCNILLIVTFKSLIITIEVIFIIVLNFFRERTNWQITNVIIITTNNCNIKCLETPFVDYQPRKNIGEGTLSINNSRCVGKDDFSFIFANSFSSITFNNFDTSKVTNLNYMFDECIGVASLNLSGWDARLVDSAYCVFIFCDKLQSVDLSGWDLSNLKDDRFDNIDCSDNLKTVYARGCNQATIDELKKLLRPSVTIVTE